MHKRALLAYQVVAALLFAAILPLPFAAAQEVSTPAAPGPEVTAAVVTLTATADTTIREGSPGTNYGTLSLLTVERDDFLQQAVVLQNFDLSGILPGSTIHSAELQLNLQEATGGFPTIPVDVSRITGFWTETAVTWNSRPGWTCCDATVSVGTAVGTDYTWDVTTLVDDWVNDGATHPNRGVALSGPAGFHQRAFASRESVSEPPRLVIDYTPPPPDAAIVASVYQAIPSVKRDDNILGIDAWVQQDFYLKMSVNGEPDLTSPVVDQRDYAEWNPPFTGTADVIAAQRFYPVRIELWDEDDVDPDDQFNINPIAPSPDVSKTLNVLFDACTLRWSAGSLSFGPGPSWVPYPMPENVGQLAQIQMAIAPVDARSFAPDDIAITHAEPVQAVYGARQIIAEKATAFRLDLSSSQPGPAQVSVEVTLSDGLSSATHIRNAIVPTDGLRLFFFDGSDGVGPFFPKKADDARLTYDVVVTVLSGEGDDPAWNDCQFINNEILGAWLPIVETRNPQVVYVPWDYDDTLNTPPMPAFLDTVNANEPFRLATFPISETRTLAINGPYFTPFGRGTTDILGILPDWAAIEPGQTLVWENIGAMVAGIERMVLVPRQTFWEENLFRLTTGTSTTIGLSLAEWGPHVVIAEAGTSQTAVHELGHTYTLSRQPCSTGGVAEDLFLAGCRDEYNHTAGDGRPYLGSGYDVLGQIYPTGNGGTTGTREVLNVTNLMDTTGAGIGGYNRWIDRLSYTYLTDAMRVPQDPELVTIAGVLRAQDGFDAPEVNLVGLLLPAYQFEGLPDLEQMPYDEPSGAGFFAIHLETGQGDRIYRFDPWFRTVPGGGGEVAFFAFAVEWDSAMQAISLHGPSYPADPFQSQDQELFRINRTPTIPNVGPMTATTSAGRQPHPVVAPGQDVTISWSAGDGDADDLRATLLLKPADSATWFPYGIHLDGTEFTIPGAQLAGRPGSYDARLLVTDGVNTAQVEEQDLFTVTAGVRIYLPMVVKR